MTCGRWARQHARTGRRSRRSARIRSYKQQVSLFKSYAGADYHNFDSAITYSARPGHSEHQTGLTIDFGSIGDTGLTSNWEVTKAGGWMAKNAWKYGWLMSYPNGKKDLVCYRYEPWHYRYVGRDLAAKIHESGLTIREYLWANYTQLDPACIALPAPKIITPGVPRSCAFAGGEPVDATSGDGRTHGSREPGSTERRGHRVCRLEPGRIHRSGRAGRHPARARPGSRGRRRAARGRGDRAGLFRFAALARREAAEGTKHHRPASARRTGARRCSPTSSTACTVPWRTCAMLHLPTSPRACRAARPVPPRRVHRRDAGAGADRAQRSAPDGATPTGPAVSGGASASPSGAPPASPVREPGTARTEARRRPGLGPGRRVPMGSDAASATPPSWAVATLRERAPGARGRTSRVATGSTPRR